MRQIAGIRRNRCLETARQALDAKMGVGCGTGLLAMEKDSTKPSGFISSSKRRILADMPKKPPPTVIPPRNRRRRLSRFCLFHWPLFHRLMARVSLALASLAELHCSVTVWTCGQSPANPL